MPREQHFDEYLDTRGLSERTGIGKSTFDKMRMTGNGPPFIKVGKKVIYSRPCALAWLNAHTRQSTAPTQEVA
jgi:hypothetical protein